MLSKFGYKSLISDFLDNISRNFFDNICLYVLGITINNNVDGENESVSLNVILLKLIYKYMEDQYGECLKQLEKTRGIINKINKTLIAYLENLLVNFSLI